jgi:hypothetical protein
MGFRSQAKRKVASKKKSNVFFRADKVQSTLSAQVHNLKGPLMLHMVKNLDDHSLE